MGVNRFYVLLFSMMLLGAAMAAGDYSPSSNPHPEFQHKEPVEKPDLHFPHMPHPEFDQHKEHVEKPDLLFPHLPHPEFDQHKEHVQKPDLHFPHMPHPEFDEHKEPVEKPDLHFPHMPHPEFQHKEPVEKPDLHFPHMPHPEFQHKEPVEKPDLHFPHIPHPEFQHKEPVEKPYAQWVHKPEESEKHTMGKGNAKLFDEPKFDHDGPVKKQDFHFADMPHHQTHSESYDKEAAHWMPKPKESEKPYDAEPKFQHNEPIEKPDFHFPDMPHPKIHVESYNKPVVAQPVSEPEESEKPMLEKDSKSKSYDEPKFQHNEPIEKPDLHFPNLPKTEPTKPVGDYHPKPEVEHTKPVGDYHPNPNYEMPKLNIPKPEEAFPEAVEGIVICKSASGYVPIKGAVVRITCFGVDDEGYDKAPVSCQTSPTDTKGYFFKTLPAASNNKVKNSWENCKAFLEQSPMEECRVPSNVNKGIEGHPLSSHRVLQDKHLKLYPVGPFFYTPEPMAKPTVKKAPATGDGY